MIKLSILIPTLLSRDYLFHELLQSLQAQKTDEVEICSHCDDGTLSIGEKRNDLLKMAMGDYIAFIDDDDAVAPDYVDSILKAIKDNPDVVGMEGVMTTDGHTPLKFIHSLEYKTWYEENGVFYRNPNHLNPVKRELALKAMFPEWSHGEDKEYSMRLLPHLNKEVRIVGPIYYYKYRTNK